MTQQKKKMLIIVVVLILAIALIVVWAIGISLMEKKPTGNNGVSTEVNSENVTDVDTEKNTESIQGVESEVESEDETTEKEETEVVVPPTSETKEPEEAKPKWTVTDMNKTMYAKSSVNVRKGPGTEYEKLGSLSTNQEVYVTGKCNEFDWYRINYNGNEAYVSCSYLVDEKIVNNVTNNNEDNYNENDNEDVYVDDGSGEYIEKEDPLPSTPEPAYGTIVFEGHPEDGWAWNFIDSADIWYEEEKCWGRACKDAGFSTILTSEEVYDYSKEVYPLRTDKGEYDGQRIEYPTFWIYVGDGPL